MPFAGTTKACLDLLDEGYDSDTLTRSEGFAIMEKHTHVRVRDFYQLVEVHKVRQPNNTLPRHAPYPSP